MISLTKSTDLVSVVYLTSGREIQCGIFPRAQAEGFLAWVRGYCPNRHYVIREEGKDDRQAAR